MSLTKSPPIAALKRWIKASIKKELTKWLQGGPVFIEGEDRSTSKDPQHYELRIDGPYLRPIGSNRDYCAYIEVNILASSTRDESNVYGRENLQGQMQYALNRDICIYRTGNVGKDEADTETQIGVMQLLPVDQIKVSDFGMIDTNTEIYQAVAEAHYEMYFTLEP